jgi:hypothetical protein
MTGAQPPRCPRARGLVDRIVAEAVNEEDRAHAPGCESCGPLLARAARFDDELRRTARRLVAEELPRGILDPGLAGRPEVHARRPAPGLAGIIAAVAVVAVATSVALFPGGLGGPTTPPSGPVASGPAPTPLDTSLQMGGPGLNRTSRIGGSLIGGGWTCTAGRPVETPAGTPGSVDHEGILCSSPKTAPSVSIVVVTGETVDNEVVEVAMKGEQLGPDSDSTRRAIAELLSKATYSSIFDEAAAQQAGAFVSDRLPELRVLVTGDDVTRDFARVRLTLQREPDGTYFLLLQALPPA